MNKLILVPTPIDDSINIDSNTFEVLSNAAMCDENLILVEEHKAARRRWIKWGLPREAIDKFQLYNEHTRDDLSKKIVNNKKVENVYLMSDCGLPAFCDPGRELVSLCHDKNILVTSLPFHNSVILALALSGFNSTQFHFEGFLPRERTSREERLTEVLKNSNTVLLMDTPYRLGKLLSELSEKMKKLKVQRRVFLGMELGSAEEELYRGKSDSALSRYKESKKRFVLVLESK